MKLTSREKILLSGVLILIFAALFINFVYFPLNKKIKNLHTQSNGLELQLQDVRLKQVDVEKLKDEITELQDDIEEKSKGLIKKWDQAELLVFVESSMNNLSEKVSIEMFDPLEACNVQAGDVNVTITTNYDNLLKIWKNMEKAKYFNTITKFSIDKIMKDDPASKKDDKNGLQVTMNIKFYSDLSSNEFPEKYNFMTGKFGKKDIFNLKKK